MIHLEHIILRGDVAFFPSLSLNVTTATGRARQMESRWRPPDICESVSDGEKINSRSSFEACVNIVLNIILMLALATGLAGRKHTSAHLAGDFMRMMGLVKGVCVCVC